MKSNFIKVLCLAALMLTFGAESQAQFRHFRQSIYLNGVLPTGDFGSAVSANSVTGTQVPLTFINAGKGAMVGFGAGYRVSYRFDIGMGEVAPYVGGDLFWNMLNGDLRNDYLQGKMTAPTYFNIPIMAGISYNYDELNTNFPLIPFGEFGVGADIMMVTREGSSGNYFAYKPSTTVCWMLGAGVFLGNYVSVGAYYYGLGTHPMDYTAKTLKDNTYASLQDETTGERQLRNIGSFALRVGFHF